jgi:hypothetical protein
MSLLPCCRFQYAATLPLCHIISVIDTPLPAICDAMPLLLMLLTLSFSLFSPLPLPCHITRHITAITPLRHYAIIDAADADALLFTPFLLSLLARFQRSNPFVSFRASKASI